MGAGQSSECDISFEIPKVLDNFKNQSKLMPDDNPEGIRASVLEISEDDIIDKSLDNFYDNFVHGSELVCQLDISTRVLTLRKLLTISEQTQGRGQCLGTRAPLLTPHINGANAKDAPAGAKNDRPYEWQTYEEVKQKADDFGLGLRHFGMAPQREKHNATMDILGIYATNCAEYTIAVIGCSKQSIPVCPLYDTLGQGAIRHILEQTSMRVAMCDTFERACKLIKSVKQNSGAGDKIHLERVVVINGAMEGEAKDEAFSLGAMHNVEICTFDQVCEQGREQQFRNIEDVPAKSDDIFLLCYTSGTTGQPKGVMLTHGNMLSSPHAVLASNRVHGLDVLNPHKTTFSYLPMAHIFEIAIQTYALYCGARIGFYSGNMLTLMDDLKVLQPTMMPVVPRILSRLHDSIQHKVSLSGALSKLVFKKAYEHKLAKMRDGVVTKNTIADRLVFRKIQHELGGKVEFMITGAAPISPEVLTLCRVSLGSVIVEGYGQTECSAAGTMTLPGESAAGHVGPPLPHNEVKLAPVPELNYAGGSEGEVCFRGPNIMKGYFKMEQETKNVIDADGWLHTGDIAKWHENGTLTIIDRKKHIFKLAQGEYVAPEKIENVLTRMNLINQLFVEGNSLQRYLVAIVVPDEQVAKEWLLSRRRESGAETDENKQKPIDLSDICANAELQQYLLSEISNFGRANGLNSIELPKAIYLCSEPFSVENGLLTPTLKPKRADMRKHFADIVNRLYEDNPEIKAWDCPLVCVNSDSGFTCRTAISKCTCGYLCCKINIAASALEARSAARETEI